MKSQLSSSTCTIKTAKIKSDRKKAKMILVDFSVPQEDHNLKSSITTISFIFHMRILSLHVFCIFALVVFNFWYRLILFKIFSFITYLSSYLRLEHACSCYLSYFINVN